MLRLVSLLVSAYFSLNCLVSNAQALDPTQIYNTGNIVVPTTTTSGSTWINGVYQDSLTCWAWGNPGYCGPNPIVGPSNTINFSFGYTDLYQQQSIAGLLPESGTGLRINGYNFSFTAKNGNGWDDGRVDILYAYVQLNDKNNISLVNQTYNLNSQFNWTTFNYNHTFPTPYAAATVGSVRYGFIGKDNNNWAGPYGPEIYNISFGLKYSVDPCFVNVLSSPNCPGYLAALNKLQPAPTVVESVAPSLTTPTTQLGLSVQTSESQNQTTTSSNTITVSGAAPTAGNPQPRVGEITVAGSRDSASKSVSTAQILSILRNEQSRIANLETATAQTAVDQAQQVATQATQANESFALNNIAATNSNSQSLAMSGNTFSGQGLSIGNENTTVNANRLSINMGIEFTRRSNNFVVADTNIKEGASVNTETKDNELAGTVSIDQLNVVPKGFELYLNSLKDVAFYAPKEIYTGQRTVDNARIQRVLTGASERLHQEMVDQQYNLDR